MLLLISHIVSYTIHYQNKQDSSKSDQLCEFNEFFCMQGRITLKKLQKIVLQRQSYSTISDKEDFKGSNTQDINVTSPFYKKCNAKKQNCLCLYHKYKRPWEIPSIYKHKHQSFSKNLTFHQNHQTIQNIKYEHLRHVNWLKKSHKIDAQTHSTHKNNSLPFVHSSNDQFNQQMKQRQRLQQFKRIYLKALSNIILKNCNDSNVVYLQNNLNLVLNHYKLSDILKADSEKIQKIAAYINCSKQTTIKLLNNINEGVVTLQRGLQKHPQNKHQLNLLLMDPQMERSLKSKNNNQIGANNNDNVSNIQNGSSADNKLNNLSPSQSVYSTNCSDIHKTTPNIEYSILQTLLEYSDQERLINGRAYGLFEQGSSKTASANSINQTFYYNAQPLKKQSSRFSFLPNDFKKNSLNEEPTIQFKKGDKIKLGTLNLKNQLQKKYTKPSQLKKKLRKNQMHSKKVQSQYGMKQQKYFDAETFEDIISAIEGKQNINTLIDILDKSLNFEKYFESKQKLLQLLQNFSDVLGDRKLQLQQRMMVMRDDYLLKKLQKQADEALCIIQKNSHNLLIIEDVIAPKRERNKQNALLIKAYDIQGRTHKPTQLININQMQLLRDNIYDPSLVEVVQTGLDQIKSVQVYKTQLQQILSSPVVQSSHQKVILPKIPEHKKILKYIKKNYSKVFNQLSQDIERTTKFVSASLYD